MRKWNLSRCRIEVNWKIWIWPPGEVKLIKLKIDKCSRRPNNGKSKSNVVTPICHFYWYIECDKPTHSQIQRQQQQQKNWFILLTQDRFSASVSIEEDVLQSKSQQNVVKYIFSRKLTSIYVELMRLIIGHQKSIHSFILSISCYVSLETKVNETKKKTKTTFDKYSSNR